MATEPKVPWYKTAAARWVCAVALPATLAVVCPMLPWPAAQVICKVGGQVLSQVPAQQQPAPAPSSGAQWWTQPCSDGQPPQSAPYFCRCVSGQWRDYFDAGTPCGQ